MIAALRLYEIPAEFRAIDEAIDDLDGEITPEIEARLDALVTGELALHVDSIVALVRENETAAHAYHAEAQRLADLSRGRLRAAERLKEYLRANLEACGLDGAKGRLFRVRVQKNGRPSIRWEGRPETIPEPYRRVSIDLDGTAAYEAWKAGTLPAGFDVALGSHLRIS